MTSLPKSALSYEIPQEFLPSTRQEFLQPVVRRLSLVMLAGGYLWGLAVIFAHHPDPYWSFLVSPFCLIGSAVLVLGLVRDYRMGSVTLSVGLCLASLLQVRAGAFPVGQSLAILPTLLIGLLAGPTAGIAIAVVFAVAILNLGVPGTEQWPPILHALMGSAVAATLGEDMVHALSRAESSETRAWALARESMQRRGELRHTSGMLHNMYALLERTNEELEVARREAEEARQIKARFAANISHELRTPLNLILGFSRMMYRSPEVYGNVHWTPSLRADVREIHNASRHLLGMIDDVLDLSRIDAQRLPLKLEDILLPTLVDEAVSTARGLLRGSTVTLSVDVPRNLPRLVGDRTRIRQVILNLLNNAIRFTDSGSIVISAREGDGELEVSVVDTGVGIAPAELQVIFEEFSQGGMPALTGRGGAGLGLAVCKQFVQLHGGRISASSRLGEGSVFRFTIPLPGSGRARSRLAYYSPDVLTKPTSSGTGTKCVVVLTLDEKAARHLARGIEGYRVIPVSNLAALSAIVEAEHPAGIVIVYDPLASLRAPSVDEVAALVCRPDLGIVEWMVPTEDAARDYLQVEGYLNKPVEVEQLIEAIRRCGALTDRILIADDDAGFRELIRRVVSVAFPAATIVCCSNGADSLRAMEHQSFDVVLMDLVMPELDGVNLLKRAREAGILSGKVIVTTGAPYVEELTTIFSPRLHFSKRSLPRGMEWFHCIKALLDTAPPDYSRPRVAPARQSDPQPQSAS